MLAMATAPLWVPALAAAALVAGAVVVGNAPLLLLGYGVYRKWRRG